MTTDPTTQRSGNVSQEGRAADGIVQVPTDYSQDTKARNAGQRQSASKTAFSAKYDV